MRFRILVHGGRRPLLGYESESRKPNPLRTPLEDYGQAAGQACHHRKRIPLRSLVLRLLQDGEAPGQCAAAGQRAKNGFAGSDSRSDAGGQGGCVG
jgi:hypothetical protein